MNIAALLPIKEHSERIPQKNFRLLCGRPLWTWTLQTLLQAGCFSSILIDTDSAELIQTIACTYPEVKTCLRPVHLRGDSVSMNDIIAHDIAQLPQAELFFQTHATNPLITTNTILRAIETYRKLPPEYDALFSVNRIQARTYWHDGKPVNHSPGRLARTQDLEPVFEENSNFFIFTPQAFQKSKTRLGTKPFLFETPRIESLEIDEPEDFRLVELVARALLEERDHG